MEVSSSRAISAAAGLLVLRWHLFQLSINLFVYCLPLLDSRYS